MDAKVRSRPERSLAIRSMGARRQPWQAPIARAGLLRRARRAARACVLRPTLAGHRHGSAASARHHRPGAHRAWAPRMGPAPADPSRPPCARPLRAAPPSGRALRRARRRSPQCGGGACGRRHHSRCPCRPGAWPVRSARSAGGQGWCPASVGRRTQAPPPRCRHGAGTRRHDGNGRIGVTATGREPAATDRVSLQISRIGTRRQPPSG